MAARAVLLLALLALSACSSTPPGELRTGRLPPKRSDHCLVRRAAFDIGSATTKLKVADIDVCTRRIVKVLLAEDQPVFYRDDVMDSARGSLRFRDETLAKGMETLRGLKERAAAFEPEGYAGVATSAFRKADNGEAYVARLRRELGIHVRVISQGEEAELGFVGSLASLGVEPEQAVVWDVGGQSMQLTVLDEQGGLYIYLGQLASGQMRSYILREVQRKSQDAATPNPISRTQAQAARAHAAAFARGDVPDVLKAVLQRPKMVVVGIGALKYFRDEPAAERGICTQSGLDRSIAALVGKTDAEIGGPYAGTQLSDRLLIAGFMDGLAIEQVLLADVDLSDGLLFHPDYWEE
jgi:exopolyphosphatase/guanosine-5'-triphosphate,3'-diphosphate pyrophosphatase